MTDSERIEQLERRIEEFKRDMEAFKFQWLDRNDYGAVSSYKPPKGKQELPQLPESVKDFWRGDGWRG